MTPRSIFVSLLSVLALALPARAQEADFDVWIDDVRLRPGVTIDLHVKVYVNEAHPCSDKTIVAVPGMTAAHFNFEPFAEAIFSDNPTGRKVCRVAEASRETEWKRPSFMREMFLGNFRLDLIDPYRLHPQERPEFLAFYEDFVRFLEEEVDSVEIDATGESPERVLQRLREMGAFGMKIPTEYGGLGFSHHEYQRIMQLLGSTDGNLSALISAHQSIGVPQPLNLFGSAELKKKYLPRCARGEISAFALTEADVGSDPARLATTAVRTPEGDAYVLNGTKL